LASNRLAGKWLIWEIKRASFRAMLGPLRKIVEGPRPSPKKTYREADTQKKIVAWARDRGWLAVRLQNERRRKYGAARDIALGLKPGIPDLWLDFKGHECWLELKAGKGKLSPDQLQTQAELRARGKTVYNAWSLEEAQKCLEQFELAVHARSAKCPGP
jgi:hypothetical protein